MGSRDLKVDLAGRRVLVTGGSRGIAAAIVLAFAENGADVAFSFARTADLAAQNGDAADKLHRQVASSGRRVNAIEADLTIPGAAATMAETAERQLGGIDIVVLSASIQVHKPFLEMPPEDIGRQFQVNLTSNIETLQKLIPGMRSRGFGRVINIGSVQESAPSIEMPVYAMTKSAIENLVRNLAGENAPFGITVNNIAPGLIETDRNAFRRAESMDNWTRLTRRANPMRRAGQPEDIVGAALFLASNASAFVTGTTIQATGGAHIPRASNDPSD